MKLIYVVHPFGGNPANLERARRWYRWLVSEFPRNAYVCQWVFECEVLDLGDDAVSEFGLERDIEVLSRCDAVLLVGGEVTLGMQQRANVALVVLDLTMIGDEPPEVGSHAWITTAQIGLVAGVLDSAFRLVEPS